MLSERELKDVIEKIISEIQNLIKKSECKTKIPDTKYIKTKILGIRLQNISVIVATKSRLPTM